MAKYFEGVFSTFHLHFFHLPLSPLKQLHSGYSILKTEATTETPQLLNVTDFFFPLPYLFFLSVAFNIADHAFF